MHVRPATCACPVRVGLAITIYIRCIYGLFGRNITKYTVIYGVYIQFWPTLRKSLARSWAKKIFDRQLQYCTTLPQELSMPLFIHCLLWSMTTTDMELANEGAQEQGGARHSMQVGTEARGCTSQHASSGLRCPWVWLKGTILVIFRAMLQSARLARTMCEQWINVWAVNQCAPSNAYDIMCEERMVSEQDWKHFGWLWGKLAWQIGSILDQKFCTPKMAWKYDRIIRVYRI